jgi:hypothetical protein
MGGRQAGPVHKPHTPDPTQHRSIPYLKLQLFFFFLRFPSLPTPDEGGSDNGSLFGPSSRQSDSARAALLLHTPLAIKPSRHHWTRLNFQVLSSFPALRRAPRGSKAWEARFLGGRFLPFFVFVPGREGGDEARRARMDPWGKEAGRVASSGG